MTFAVLQSRTVSADFLRVPDFEKRYGLLGEFYEHKDRRTGGADYVAEELERYVQQSPLQDLESRNESLTLQNHSLDLQKMNLICILLPNRSKEPYIFQNYSLYRVYLRKR